MRQFPRATLLSTAVVLLWALDSAGREKHLIPAEGPAMSGWGDERGGLRCRISSLAEIEQGMPLEVEIVLRSYPQNLRPGTKALNAFLGDAFWELTLINLDSRKATSVRPYDPTRGTPVLDEGKDTIPLDGTAIKPWRVSFPLATVFDSLSPGAYECQVRYSFPDQPTSWWRGTAEQWQAAGFWHGNVTSGTFPLSIKKQSAQTQAILLPERLRAETSHDEGGRTRTLVRFRKRDAKHVNLPIRNGHFLGWKVYRPGEPGLRMQSGTPRPEGANPIAEWFEDKSGEKLLVTIEVFETAVAAHHHWAPERSGFRVLWQKSFAVSVKETALTRHDATIVCSSGGPFNGWALGHDNAARIQRIAYVDCSRNIWLRKTKGLWKLAKTDRGYLILAQNGPYDGWYLGLDPNGKVETVGQRDCANNLVLRRRLDAGCYWKLTEADQNYLIQSQDDKFADWYLDLDLGARVSRSFQGEFTRNLLLTKARSETVFWQVEPNNDRAGMRHAPVVGQYLATAGARLDCYFTLERSWSSSVFERTVSHPDPAMTTIDELVENLRKQLEGVKVVRNSENPAVIHLIEESLARRKNYVMEKRVDLTYSGVLAGICIELEKRFPKIGPRRGDILSGVVIADDHITTVRIDAKGQPIRELLTSAVPLEKYGRIIWESKTRKEGQGWNPETSVKFLGRRR